jgi:phenylalanyl-tRNA synthetase beta chain
MIASAKELGLSDDHDGILRLATLGLDPALGTDALELLGLNESAAEVNVTPDRGYCFSIRGIAREFSHATGKPFTDPASQIKPLAGEGFKLSVEDATPIHGVPGCSKFVLLAVEGIDATSPTPSWMENRLKLAGMRSISIAVDVTNYVMLELGQPLHAYDMDKLTGGITVRRAKPGETIVTLDDKERKLDVEDLLICDDSGPIGIAGVMGGAKTEVSDSTTRVLLEAAIFDPISIARSARRHKLPSEASRRFERGVDFEISPYAAARAAQLLEQLAGGKTGTLGSNWQLQPASRVISMPIDFPAQLVGYPFTSEQVIGSLELIGCKVVPSGEQLEVTPPSWRPDLGHKTDLAEEVARLVGYEVIPATIPVAPPGRGLTRTQKLRRNVLGTLTGAGFVEVLNYPFLSTEQNSWFSSGPSVSLENPLQGEFPELRKELLPGLLQAAARNVSRGNLQLALIEEGSVFLTAKGAAVTTLPVGNVRPSAQELEALNASIPHQPRHLAGVLVGNWTGQSPTSAAQPSGLGQAVAAVELVAAATGSQLDLVQGVLPGMHPGRAAELKINGETVGLVGELHPELAEELHLPGRVTVFEIDLSKLFELSPKIVQAREISVMPVAMQDVSLVVPLDTVAGALRAALTEGAGELLESIALVDDYRGAGLPEGKKSLTFALSFRAKEKTLTQAEATAAKEAAVALASERFGAELRA